MKYFKQPIKILAVDDNPVNLFLVKTIINKIFDCAEIITAATGEEGVAIYRNSPIFDLILMDIQLPGIDGFEAIRLIKKIETKHSTRIVALSGNKLENMMEKGKMVGMDGYLSKPIKVEPSKNLFKKLLVKKD
ncbi:response regulator [Zunongwangia sp. HGR-M22]|uniref:response regulator n=1 Tax=Zunongwangia sp. HGR-M22 TaxID=3015168 RepID=UPI0022DE6D1C|nr:response regulator [Zunongwangia sp. HGR-M22]WBL24904.1 response regulator [Zunongwangia sp. HGR-M22]